METFTIPVVYEIPFKDLECLLDSAFETGSGYWCRIMNYQTTDLNQHFLSLGTLAMTKGCAVICRRKEEETDEKFTPLTLDKSAVVRGFVLLAKDYPRDFANFLSGRGDSCTSDIFLQLCLLGSVEYG